MDPSCVPLAAIVLVSLSLAAVGCRHSETAGAHANHRFDDAEAWAASFDDPARDDWQKPDVVLDLLALPSNALVADIGAATGYFAVRLAQQVKNGRVYGIDVESSMVEYLAKRARAEELGNLRAVLATFDDAKIPEPVDLIIIVNTYHHLEDRTAYFKRLAASLKTGGRIAIIDFKMNSTMGPPDSAKVKPEVVVEEVTAAGYRLSAEHQVLSEQFFFVFTKTA
jgi:cyclopropane fatty-acyl-phospholipid synthase-like methyltransferase